MDDLVKEINNARFGYIIKTAWKQERLSICRRRPKSTLGVERALREYDGGLSAVEDDQPVRGAHRQEAPLRTRADRVDAGGRRDL